MGFFSKLFGKSDTSKNTNNTNNLENQSDTVTIDVNNQLIYPFFINEEYIEEQLPTNSLALGFHHNEDESTAVFQTLALLEGDELSVIGTHDMSDTDFQALINIGLKRIEELDLEFEFHPEFNQEVLKAGQGHILTCETILSVENMLKAHLMLDTEEIMVSIPRRRIMMICKKDANDETKNMFLTHHAYFWLSDENNGTDRISKDIFVLKNGEIDSVFFVNI